MESGKNADESGTCGSPTWTRTRDLRILTAGASPPQVTNLHAFTHSARGKRGAAVSSRHHPAGRPPAPAGRLISRVDTGTRAARAARLGGPPSKPERERPGAGRASKLGLALSRHPPRPGSERRACPRGPGAGPCESVAPQGVTYTRATGRLLGARTFNSVAGSVAPFWGASRIPAPACG